MLACLHIDIMKNNHLVFLILLIIPLKIFSQTNGQIINDSTKEAVPYANIWIENEDIGTTSDQFGKFSFNQTFIGKNLVVSAIGFERMITRIESEAIIIKLTSRFYEIDDVIIKPSGNSDKLVIDKFDDSKINSYYACGDKPWITAKLFKYEDRFESKPFIYSLKLLTNNHIKSCTFGLRFIEVDELGAPGNELLNKTVIVKAKKGKHIVNVNLSEFYIEIPKNGLFIAVEWLIIKKNKYEYIYHDFSDEIVSKEKRVEYEPSLGTVPKDNNDSSWIYDKGNWKKAYKMPKSMKISSLSEKYPELAIELTLSN